MIASDNPNFSKHSIPAVMVQYHTADLIPCMLVLCNKQSHADCRHELASILNAGGFIVRGTYWHLDEIKTRTQKT
jgi:hypothetical protein